MKHYLKKPVNNDYDTPLLLICYNRSQYIQRQISEIKKIKPTNIFIACDGPKDSNDAIKVNQVRKTYLSLIDWDCKVNTLFAENNQGCFKGVKGALEWFFNINKEGIILEDDIIPTEDFFYFMKVMLEHFRDDQKVFSISGCNLGYEASNDVFSSRIMNMWGWATWSDRFFKIDFKIKSWCEISNKRLYLYKKLRYNILDYDKKWIDFWISIFDKAVDNDNFSTWDYQVIYNQLHSGKKTIYPSLNLVNNLGFDSDATHTTDASHVARYLKTHKLKWPLKLPYRVKNDAVFYQKYIKERWAYYKRPNWKYFLGQWLKPFTAKP